MAELKNSLRFNENGKFKILMVSDFHADTHFNPKLVKSFDALIEYSNPDLVVIAGDTLMVNSRFTDLSEYRRALSYILEPVESRKIPWFQCFGNHDKESGYSNEVQQKQYESFDCCISEAGPEEVSGVGNFVRTVYSYETGEPKFNLWALDSNSSVRDYVEKFKLKPEHSAIRMPNPLGTSNDQASVFFDQVMWYYNESSRMEKEFGAKIPALMFMHVPIMEMNLIADNPERCRMKGSKRETICCGEMNSGLFMACLQRGDVKGIFAGHEHLCDFQGEYCGITLGYDGCLGFNMSAHDDLRGGKVIELSEDGTFTAQQVRLVDIMGADALRNPEFIEGGCEYFIRNT